MKEEVLEHRLGTFSVRYSSTHFQRSVNYRVQTTLWQMSCTSFEAFYCVFLEEAVLLMIGEKVNIKNQTALIFDIWFLINRHRARL